MKNKKAKFIIGSAMIVSALGYLIGSSIQSTSTTMRVGARCAPA